MTAPASATADLEARIRDGRSNDTEKEKGCSQLSLWESRLQLWQEAGWKALCGSTQKSEEKKNFKGTGGLGCLHSGYGWGGSRDGPLGADCDDGKTDQPAPGGSGKNGPGGLFWSNCLL